VPLNRRTGFDSVTRTATISIRANGTSVLACTLDRQNLSKGLPFHPLARDKEKDLWKCPQSRLGYHSTKRISPFSFRDGFPK